jgi:hypothetical protein
MKILLKAIILIIVISISSYSIAQSPKIKIAPEKSWVTHQPFNVDAKPDAGQDGSTYYLLMDDQENTVTEENYIHYAYKILSNEGIQDMSDLSFEYDPSYESLIFHKIVIHRKGVSINKLSLNKIRTIQREQSMDRNLYDGAMTAIVNLTDVRVGDIIEYAFTRKGYNPVNDGHITRKITIDYTTPYEHAFHKLIIPKSKQITIKNNNTDLKPEIIQEGNTISHTWTFEHVHGISYDNHEPDWYDSARYVLISDFKTWAEVSTWASPLYTISEADKRIIKEKVMPQFDTTDLESYALRAIRFVQDEIRYLGFEEGMNSHKPHAPIKVYEQRFGDCKDKSLLLTSILEAKGIKASPVLVSTTLQSKCSERLPSPFIFNHCVVQMELNDHIVYIDPTINNQGGTLFNIYFPSYGKGLIINKNTTDFVDFPPPVVSSISEDQTFDVAKIGGEAILTIKTTYTGSEADNQRSSFSESTLESIQKTYLTFYGNLYPDIEKTESMSTTDDRIKNVFEVTEHYKINTFWKPYPQKENEIYCELYAQSLENYFNVTKSNNRTAPYQLRYPLDYQHRIHVFLPEDWSLTPDDQRIERDAYRYEFETSFTKREVYVYTHYMTKQDYVAVDDFEQFVKDHQTMMSNLSYYLTYNKNLASGNNHSNINWPAVIACLSSIAFGGWLILWLYRNYDPEPYFSNIGAESLGGWLILIGIGITISPLRMIVDIFNTQQFSNAAIWSALLKDGRYGTYIFLLLEQIYNMVLLLFSVLIVILFYQRRSSLPLLIIIYLVTNSTFLILDTLVTQQLNPGMSTEPGYYKNMIQSIVAACIWVPYFKMSSRVKETFVIRANEN